MNTTKAARFTLCISFIVMSLMLANLSYSKVNPDSIVGMWLFEADQGEVASDLSGNQNDAVFNGGPKWTNGKFGRAISFDGSDDYLSVEDSDSLDVVGEAITLLAWINADGWPANWNHIIRKTPGDPRFYILGVHSDGLPFTFLKTDVQQYSDIQGTTVLSDNEWIHLAMTYNGKEITIYVNGEPDVTQSASGVIEASGGELRIGRGAPAGYFTGTIDEVAIFQVALSQDEIKTIMNDGLEATALSVEAEDKLPEIWGSIKSQR